MGFFTHTWIGRRLTGALLGAAVWLAALAALAEQQPLPRLVSRDCELTIRVRQALTRDESLAPLNLGVSVRSGRASVWGMVASEETAHRAVERVRQVPGIVEVRCELWVVRPGDPLLELLAQPAKPQPPDLVPQPSPSAPASALASRPRPAAPAPGAAASNTVARDADKDIAVLPAIALPGPPPTPAAPLARLSPPPAGASQELLEAIERLCKSSVRFAGIQPSVEGGVVRLRGSVARSEDAFELARAVSRLPGVERVILDEIRTR